MLLQVHQESTDLLKLDDIADDFVLGSEQRLRMFGKSQWVFKHTVSDIDTTGLGMNL